MWKEFRRNVKTGLPCGGMASLGKKICYTPLTVLYNSIINASWKSV